MPDPGLTPARPTAGIKIVLFLLVWASVAWFGSWELNPNTATRMFAALSIVEDGDATIDEWDALTIDKARFGGHLYLDKAPGMTLMALPAVAAAALLSPARSADFAAKDYGNRPLATFLRARTRLAVATGPALLTALAAVLLFDLALGLTGSAGGALLAALGYALGTPAWGWSTTLFGHAPVAALFVIALWATWRLGDSDRRRYPLILGASLGWAVAIEYQAVLAGSAIAIWAIVRLWSTPRRWPALALAAAAGIAGLLPILGYNLFAFGTPFRLGYQGVVGFEGMDRGLFGLGGPDARVLWAILFGPYRGLLWVAPALVLAVLGLERLPSPGLVRTILAVSIVALLVNAAYFYWDGGNATGPRHALPLVGVLSLGLAGWWAAHGPIARAAALLVTAASIAINAMIAAAEIFAPPQYDNALTGAVWPRFVAGDLRTWPSEWLGWTPWHGLLAWAAGAALTLAWLGWQASRIDRSPAR